MSPVFYSGDLIMSVKVASDQVKVGDIVTFQTKNRELLTHRVVEIKEDGEFVTKGDASEEADVWSDGWKLEKVTTKYITRIPVIGHFIVWMKGLFVQDTDAWLKDYTDKTHNQEIKPAIININSLIVFLIIDLPVFGTVYS